MKWFKHDSSANQDAKIQNLLLDYGLEGYGLYFYCLELITANLSDDNITFELEHDARIIARNVGSTAQKITEMMQYCVKNKLFEESNGRVTCFKLAKRLDSSMTSNVKMRELIKKIRLDKNNPLNKSHDSVMMESDLVMQEDTRLEEKRRDKTKELIVSSDTKKESGKKYSDDDVKCAQWIYKRLLSKNPNHKKPNFDTWANDIRKMREIDNRSHKEICILFEWSFNDEFWSSNILSPAKLRDKFDQLLIKASNQQKNYKSNNVKSYNESFIDRHTDTSWADSFNAGEYEDE